MNLRRRPALQRHPNTVVSYSARYPQDYQPNGRSQQSIPHCASENTDCQVSHDEREGKQIQGVCEVDDRIPKHCAGDSSKRDGRNIVSSVLERGKHDIRAEAGNPIQEVWCMRPIEEDLSEAI